MLEKLKNQGKCNDKVKTRARKGIPESVRGIAWPILVKADDNLPAEFAEGGKQEWMKTLL